MEILDDVRVFFDEGRAAEIPQNKLERAFMLLVRASRTFTTASYFRGFRTNLIDVLTTVRAWPGWLRSYLPIEVSMSGSPGSLHRLEHVPILSPAETVFITLAPLVTIPGFELVGHRHAHEAVEHRLAKGAL